MMGGAEEAKGEGVAGPGLAGAGAMGAGDEAEIAHLAAARFCLYFLCSMGLLSFAICWIFLAGLPDMAVAERLGFLLPYAILLAAYGLGRLPLWGRIPLAAAYGIPCAISIMAMFGAKENNLWDYRVNWREIAADIQREDERPRAVIFDSRHFGALGWYYLRPGADSFFEVRAESEAGRLASLPRNAAVARSAAVYYIRSARDTSPGQEVARLEESLEAALGSPVSIGHRVSDRPAFHRLKELFRRGSGVPTLPYKITILKYHPGNNN